MTDAIEKPVEELNDKTPSGGNKKTLILYKKNEPDNELNFQTE